MPGLAYTITLGKDAATPALQSLRAGLAPEQVNPIIGRSARNTYRTHLFGLNAQRANKLNGPRTNFYASAARATQFRVQGDFVIISINQVGIGLRYFGGTVRPKEKKYLTIPAIPEAHGKRASEFSGLFFAFEKNLRTGKLQPALVQGERSLLRRRRDRAGAVRTFFAGSQARRVVYWLVTEATFRPDPTVLPHPELVEAQAARAVDAYVQLIIERRNPRPPGGDN